MICRNYVTFFLGKLGVIHAPFFSPPSPGAEVLHHRKKTALQKADASRIPDFSSPISASLFSFPFFRPAAGVTDQEEQLRTLFSPSLFEDLSGGDFFPREEL